MKIVEIEYGRTINMGNFESIRIGSKAVPSDDEDPSEAFKTLIKFVNKEIEVAVAATRSKLTSRRPSRR